MIASTSSRDLFGHLVVASGLAKIIAPSALARALERVGVAPSKLTRADILLARDSLAQSLKVFLPPDVVHERLKVMMALASTTNEEGR